MPTLRVPPHSTEAEQSVLGALLEDGDAFGKIADLVTEAHFFRHEHRLIFAAIAGLVLARSSVDVITVFERLQTQGAVDDAGGLKYLNALAQSVPSAANIRRYAEIVRERATLRSLIAATDVIATQAFASGGQDLPAVLEAAQDALGRVISSSTCGVGGTRVPLLTLADLMKASGEVRWLVKGVIPAEAIGMIYGGSGTFKSFIALDAALHMAHGLRWLGRRTKRVPVLYIAAEGGAGLWGRIEAWHLARGLRWEDAQFQVIPVALDLTADAWRVVDAARVAGFEPGIVFIDTFSQTYSGEENSANEVAAYLREVGSRFRQVWRATVLLLHHTGHSATERPRGSSAIQANVDFLLSVFRDEAELIATLGCTKQKDGDVFKDLKFQLMPRKLRVDDDGDPVSSLVAWHLGTEAEVEAAAETERAAGRGGRNAKFKDLVQNGMELQSLRSAFYETLDGLNTEAKKKAFQRVLADAKRAGMFEVVGKIIVFPSKGRS